MTAGRESLEEVPMARHTLSLLLASTLILNLGQVAQARSGVEPSASKMEALKKKAAEITPGTIVEVRLLSGEKVRGRIGDLSTEGFSLDSGKAEIQKRAVFFREIKSIKDVEGRRRVVTIIVVVSSLVAGLVIAIFATGGPSR
jgi:hypothetical protein